MAGTVSGESGVGRSMEQPCQSGEALAEWRSSEQVENGTPSTSPPYWDSDDDDDLGPKPSELYGKYTWKIENFSQISKRELRSNAFEVGGYKWYILIYPQGCDVCNHLSLFLCVANHDKLNPGWSHFAQFTIAVVNKDPKKSKYSDTLHRFWKKEHDWGWKKFMELSKVLDGFVDADTLIIKAQVQVIREKPDRPFRCLDCQYRRELVRVYLTNVEQVCRRFVEDKRNKLVKLIEDKAEWSSFCTFWLGIDQSARRRMSREKTDMILKVVVKHFFIEKEVTSTLVMDSLYSGLKALEGQTNCKIGRAKLLDAEETPAPIVRVEKDVFVLVDDVLLLLERAAMEPLPPKDDKGPQNRMKDGGSGEDFNKESIERDERRLTELGRRTVEIFVLAHIFSNNIEVAYQEAVALKRQEELIREEEAAWRAENEQKAKRVAADKEKKSKKKQAKQKRNNRKGKEKAKDEKSGVAVHDKHQQEILTAERNDCTEEVHSVHEKPDTPEDVSDVSDSVDCVAEVLQHDSEDRDASPVNWDTDTSEAHPPTEATSCGISGLSTVQNGMAERKNPSVMDDSSSTCSTDSVPSVVMNGPYKGNSFPQYRSQKSPTRRKNRGKGSSDGTNCANETDSLPSEPVTDAACPNDASGSSKAAESEFDAVHSLQDRIRWLEQRVEKKEELVVSLQKKLSIKDQVDMEPPSIEKSVTVPSSPKSPPRNLQSTVHPKMETKVTEVTDERKSSSTSPRQSDTAPPPVVNSFQTATISKVEPTQKATAHKPPEKSIQQVPVVSRPSSAPVVPGPRPSAAPVVTMVQTAPLLARSASAAGRLGPEPLPAPSLATATTHSFVPQSYRNAMMGNSNPVSASTSGFTHPHSPSSSINQSLSAYTAQPPHSTLVSSAPMFLPQNSERLDPNPSSSTRSGFSFGMPSRDVLQNGSHWIEYSQNQPVNDIPFPDFYKPVQYSGSREEDFPHIDIINDLLDDEHGIGNGGSRPSSSVFQNHMLNRQFTFPGDMAGLSSDLGTSTKFERTQSYNYDSGFQYGSSNNSSHLRDMIPQMSPYSNGQIDGLMGNQWQIGSGSDLSVLGIMNREGGDGYSYHIPEYSNMNGYTVFRPSNGH